MSARSRGTRIPKLTQTPANLSDIVTPDFARFFVDHHASIIREFKRLAGEVFDVNVAVSALSIPKITVYNSGSGTHTFDTACVRYDRYMWGAGASGSAGAANAGNGGGAGARVVARNLVPPVSAAYSVGAGGTAVSNSGGGAVAGVAGGNTTWDANDLLVTAQGAPAPPTTANTGGHGGSPLRFGAGQNAANGGTAAAEGGFGDSNPEVSSNGPGGGAGGTAGAAPAFKEGAYPGMQRTTLTNGGHGGSSEQGRGGIGGASDGNGGDGTAPGGGGGGSGRRVAATVTSGNGANGRIIVIEYFT